MLLNLNRREAEALDRELGHCDDPLIAPVKKKLAAQLGPPLPVVIPGQTTIDEALEDVA